MKQTKIYDTIDDLTAGFVKDLQIVLKKNTDKINIALSGGSTPKLLFDKIVKIFQPEDFKNVHFYWSDERCVPPTDEESNYKLANDFFFSKMNIPDENIHRMRGENPPAEEAIRHEKEILENVKLIDGVPSFDLMILGMGPDGHTASIFPGQDKLVQSDKLVVESFRPETGQKRVSMTPKLINNAALILIVVTGASKAQKIGEIFRREPEAKNYPASYIDSNKGVCFWVLDNEAGSEL